MLIAKNRAEGADEVLVLCCNRSVTCNLFKLTVPFLNFNHNPLIYINKQTEIIQRCKHTYALAEQKQRLKTVK